MQPVARQAITRDRPNIWSNPTPNKVLRKSRRRGKLIAPPRYPLSALGSSPTRRRRRALAPRRLDRPNPTTPHNRSSHHKRQSADMIAQRHVSPHTDLELHNRIYLLTSQRHLRRSTKASSFKDCRAFLNRDTVIGLLFRLRRSPTRRVKRWLSVRVRRVGPATSPLLLQPYKEASADE